MSDPVAIGVDIGGTKMVACAVTADGQILDRKRLESPAFDPEGTVKLIKQLHDEMGSNLPIGVGLAGCVDGKGRFVYGPNFLHEPYDFQTRIAEETGVTCAVGNDATVALYGEQRVGAAKGVNNVVMFTIGTGVGGGLIIDGNLVAGASGYAGELGHIILNTEGRQCSSPVQGSLECYCSGQAIEQLAREKIAAGGETSMTPDDDFNGKAVTLAAIDGDAMALDVLREIGELLGKGIGSVCNVVDPELILVGGGAVTLAGQFLIPALQTTLGPTLLGYPHREPPRVATAALGDDAGMIGAALLAADRSA